MEGSPLVSENQDETRTGKRMVDYSRCLHPSQTSSLQVSTQKSHCIRTPSTMASRSHRCVTVESVQSRIQIFADLYRCLFQKAMGGPSEGQEWNDTGECI